MTHRTTYYDSHDERHIYRLHFFYLSCVNVQYLVLFLGIYGCYVTHI
jgi:hypothetical protein